MFSSSDTKKELRGHLSLAEENHMYRTLQLLILFSIIVITISFYVILYTTPLFAIDTTHPSINTEISRKIPDEDYLPTPVTYANESTIKSERNRNVIINGGQSSNRTLRISTKSHRKRSPTNEIMVHKMKRNLLTSDTRKNEEEEVKANHHPVVNSTINDTINKYKFVKDIFEPGFFLTTTELCPNNGKNIKLLVMVHSAPNNQKARIAIRQTWGHYGTRRDIAIGFLIGRTINGRWEERLATEYFIYGDIVRSNSFDSYNNLTLKTISMLEWTNTYCSGAKFLLKVDDDMFINMPRLIRFMQNHWNDQMQIYGRLAEKWKPIRDKKSKYYLSPSRYPLEVFPNFVTGPSYLLTTDSLRQLYKSSLDQLFLKLEDVFITGIVSEREGVQRIKVDEFLNRRIMFTPCAIHRAISIHKVKAEEQFDLWKKVKMTTSQGSCEWRFD